MVKPTKTSTNSTKKPVDTIARNPLLHSPTQEENSREDAEPTSLESALPSNTAHSNCINPIISGLSDKNPTSVLHSGIDSLYLSFHGQLFSSIEEQLIKYKALACSTEATQQALAVLFLNDHQFIVLPKGKGNFAYVIKNGWFHISISKATNTKMPMAYVQLDSELLTRGDFNQIIIALEYLVSLLGDIKSPPSVSRVDLKSDFVSLFILHSISQRSWICRSDNFHQYFKNKQLNGFVFGEGGDLSCRLYNKSLEIKKSKKTYLFPIWESNGWDLKQDVWRLEFQIRRSILSDFRIRTVDDLIQNIPSLWSYFTKQWLKLTIPLANDKTQSRWPLHPLWEELIKANWLSEYPNAEPLERIKKSNIPNGEYLYRNGLAPITSFMAIEGIKDFDEGAKLYLEKAHEFHLEQSKYTDKTLTTYAKEKADQKARKYHTIKTKRKEDK